MFASQDFPETTLRVPAFVEVSNGVVRWSLEAHSPSHPAPGPPSELLERFLAVDSEEGILSFALQYGVLELCSPHGLPQGHPQSMGWPREQDRFRVHEDYIAEADVAAWLNYVRTARAILSLASAYRSERPASSDDWEQLRGYGLGGVLPELRNEDLLGGVIDDFLLEAGATYRFRWLETGPALLVGNGRTPATIAVEVAQAVIGGVVSRCSGCGRFYRRERRAVRSRMNYCGRCHDDGTAERLRKARQRARRVPTDHGDAPGEGTAAHPYQ